jgi:hypothetical protein
MVHVLPSLLHFTTSVLHSKRKGMRTNQNEKPSITSRKLSRGLQRSSNCTNHVQGEGGYRPRFRVAPPGPAAIALIPSFQVRVGPELATLEPLLEVRTSQRTFSNSISLWRFSRIRYVRSVPDCSQCVTRTSDRSDAKWSSVPLFSCSTSRRMRLTRAHLWVRRIL